MEQSAAVGGNGLAVAGAEAEKGAELVIASTEPIGRPEILEAPHTSDPAFHAAVILLQPVVLVGAGSMRDMPAQRRADGAWVGTVPVRGDAIRDYAGGRLGGAEECLGRRHVPVLAEHGIDQVAVTVDRTIQIAPAAPQFQIRLIDIPRAPSGPALSTAALPEFSGQDGSDLRLPLADGFVAEDDAALQEHLAEVLQREAVAQAPEYDQGDDVRGILGPVQQPAAALVKPPPTGAAAKAPVALRRTVPPFRGGGGAAIDAVHARLPASSPIRTLPVAEPATNPGPSWRET